MFLVLIWSAGVWDGYQPHVDDEFDEEKQSATLQSIDRELRLTDACVDQPEWMCNVLSCHDRSSVLGDAQDTLISLDEEGQLDHKGKTALEIISRQLDESDDLTQQISAVSKTVLSNGKLSRDQIENLENDLMKSSTKWWDIELGIIAKKQYGIDDFNEELAHQKIVNQQLLTRALWGQGASYMALLLGLFMLPSGYRTLRQQWRQNGAPRPIRYHRQWATVLLLALFFASQLVGDWFMSYFYRLTEWFERSFSFMVAADTLWRLLPPLVVLFLIYRKPSMIVRSLGLIKKPSWAIIFGVYAVLVLLDPILGFLLDSFVSSSSNGGLDLMENGWKGLCYGIFSACIVAPIAEELSYRGLLFNALLRRTGFIFAAGLASLIFALAHNYDIYGTVSVGVFGFACAFVYRATGSLINTIILHALYNFTITIPVWLIYHYGV